MAVQSSLCKGSKEHDLGALLLPLYDDMLVHHILLLISTPFPRLRFHQVTLNFPVTIYTPGCRETDCFPFTKNFLKKWNFWKGSTFSPLPFRMEIRVPFTFLYRLHQFPKFFGFHVHAKFRSLCNQNGELFRETSNGTYSSQTKTFNRIFPKPSVNGQQLQ